MLPHLLDGCAPSLEVSRYRAHAPRALAFAAAHCVASLERTCPGNGPVSTTILLPLPFSSTNGSDARICPLGRNTAPRGFSGRTVIDEGISSSLKMDPLRSRTMRWFV